MKIFWKDMTKLSKKNKPVKLRHHCSNSSWKVAMSIKDQMDLSSFQVLANREHSNPLMKNESLHSENGPSFLSFDFIYPLN